MKDLLMIGAQFKQLSNLMKRQVDEALVRAGIDQVTGMQGWILGYVAHRQDQPIFQTDLPDAQISGHSPSH